MNASVDVNAGNGNGQTELHNAGARGADAIIRYVVEKGARLDAKDRAGRMPTDLARGGGGGRGRGNAAGKVRESTVALLGELMTGKGIPVPAPPSPPASPVFFFKQKTAYEMEL